MNKTIILNVLYELKQEQEMHMLNNKRKLSIAIKQFAIDVKSKDDELKEDSSRKVSWLEGKTDESIITLRNIEKKIIKIRTTMGTEELRTWDIQWKNRNYKTNKGGK